MKCWLLGMMHHCDRNSQELWSPAQHQASKTSGVNGIGQAVSRHTEELLAGVCCSFFLEDVFTNRLPML